MPGSDFLAKIKLILEGQEKVISGLKETQTAAQQLSKTKITTAFDKEGLATGKQIEETFTKLAPATTKSFQAMGDFEKALRRVIVVAPVWMAFRAVLQQTFALIADGFRVWEEFDRALIKSKAVIHDYSGTTDQAMVELESRIRSFSKESGIALDQLASSFYRFGTVGIAFQDALSGAIASAKLAKATLGDVDTIARSMAMAYRLLGDTIDSTLSPMEKQESLAGKIYHLWKTNAFEANEFSASLNAFVSTANIANFTADQTVSVLAALGTAGVMGSRGGALLKTSIFKLVENLDKLAGSLGLAVNPELETTFSLFMRVLTAVNELSQTKGIPATAMKNIAEIFGGVRGAQAISALNALLPELKKNLIDLGQDPQKFISDLNDRFKEVTDEVSGQLDIFRRLREQVGEAFVKGLVGASDFKNALMTINQAMEEMAIVSSKVGRFFFAMTHPLENARIEAEKTNKEFEDLYNKIREAKKGALELKDVIVLITELQERQKTTGVDWSGTINQLKEITKQIIINAETQTTSNISIEDQINKIISRREEERQKLKQLSIELQDRLSIAHTELEILTLQKAGANDLVIAHTKLDGIVSTLVDRYNNLTEAGGKQVEQISAQSVKTAILSGDFEKVLSIFKQMELTDKEINSLADSYVDIQKSILSDLDKRVSYMSQILRIANEEESAIIRQEMALKAMIYGEDYIKNSMDDRLKLAQALTKEADEQEKSSSRLVELFKIAQKYGKGIAQEVSQFLGGMKEFRALSPEALRALKRVTPAEYERGVAEEYFRPTAFRFPEEITKERLQRRDVRILQNVMVEPISIDVRLESEQVIERVKEEIIKELDNKKSELYSKINEQIGQF